MEQEEEAEGQHRMEGKRQEKGETVEDRGEGGRERAVLLVQDLRRRPFHLLQRRQIPKSRKKETLERDGRKSVEVELILVGGRKRQTTKT